MKHILGHSLSSWHSFPIGLLVYQHKKQVHTGATFFSLIFYLTWQVLFYTLPPLAVWHLLVHPFG